MAKKKRSRTKYSSDSPENTSKKSKSVKEMISNSSENEASPVAQPNMDCSLTHGVREDTNPTTPKESLVFTPSVSDNTILTSEDTPVWARELIKSVDNLRTELARVNSISENTQKALGNFIKATDALTKKVDNLSHRISAVENKNTILQSENVNLREKVLLLEFHQRRSNLVFEGIPESDDSESGHDCYLKIIQILSWIPNLDVNQVRIERCHRLGPKNRFKPRAIIAKFSWFGDVMCIMENRSSLPTGIFVNEDFPEEWNDRRRLLRPILLQAKSMDKYRYVSFLTRDKLVINGKAFTVSPINNLNELPADIAAASSCERKDANTIAFLGPHSVYSNFHAATFVSDGVKYNCAEQMIQAEKAAMFNDRVALENIMRAQNPYRIKELGSRIRNFDKNRWSKDSQSIVTRAVTAKFTQNKNLSGILKNSGSLLIVEASPDTAWGTGVHLKNTDVLNRSAWKGNGLMSEILSIVRSKIS